MNLWQAESPERPKVLSVRNFAIALALHLAFFAGFYIYALCYNLLSPKEEPQQPIDLTVVVVENLDGNEKEPPPLKKPEPEPPPPPPPPPEKPKPKPKAKEPEKPKELEQLVTNIVEKVEKKEEKKVSPPKKPELTKEERKKLLEERKKRMLQSAKKVTTKTTVTPQPNGRTDRKTLSDAEIQKLLNQGYRPGRTTQLAGSEYQRCLSLIKMAFESKWDKPAWTDTMREMRLQVKFGPGGRILNSRLSQSSTDANADRSILEAARRVHTVSGLSSEFLNKINRDDGGWVSIQFKVTPQ